MQHFSYGSWFPAYKAAAFPSTIIDLPPEFIAFLQEDGLVVDSESEALPKRCELSDIIVEDVDYDPADTYATHTPTAPAAGATKAPPRAAAAAAAAAAAGQAGSQTQQQQQHPPDGGTPPSSDASSDDDEQQQQQQQQPWPQRFPELHGAIQAAIQDLGGSVAPRLNWSSPTDALWMSSSNSLCCSHADQVILLLKSSDRAMHDLDEIAQQQQQQQSQPAVPAVPLQLVLRQWRDLAPEREFRVFVHCHVPAAISQKDASQAFPQLLAPGTTDALRGRLLDFHAAAIGSSFPASCYALDVYVPAAGAVRLLDFGPIGPATSPLLFSWAELPYRHMHSAASADGDGDECGNGSSGGQEAGDPAGGEVELRVVRQAGTILPGMRAATGMPLDMLGLQGESLEEVMGRLQRLA